MTTLSQIKLPMPRLGETMDEGTIANWLVKPGEPFKRGDALLELETDKTLVEYPALGNGALVETLVGPGDVVSVGAPIAVIATNDAWDGIGEAAKDEEPAKPEAAPEAEVPKIIAPAPVPPTSPPEVLRATPLARRVAKRNGIDLKTLIGTGRRGRIEARDVEAVIGSGTTGFMAPASAAASAHFMFVHGFAGAATNWTALRAGMQRSGLVSSASDMPGHGRNATDAPDIDTLVSWLVGEIEAVSAPVHLVGHSLGAHVCALAAMEPRALGKVSRMTLIAPAGCGHDINGTFIEGMANASTPGELAHLMRLLGPKAAALPADALNAMADEFAKGRLKALASAMARGDAQRIDTLAAVRELATRVPVTAIFGAADVICPKEHVFNMPPHVACHIVRGGHMPHWDSPGLVERLLTQSN
ncbi:MAG: alpha/beta fold hydrolase [Pseudomonadota bacterium]